MSTPKETLRQSPLQQVELILQPESMPEEARANPDNRVPLGWLLVHKKYDARKRLNLTDLSEQALKEFAVLHPMCQEIFFGPQIGFQRDYRYMRRFKGDWEGWSTHHSLGSTPRGFGEVALQVRSRPSAPLFNSPMLHIAAVQTHLSSSMCIAIFRGALQARLGSRKRYAGRRTATI